MPRPPVTKARPYTPNRGKLAGRTFTTERAYRNALDQVRPASRAATPVRSVADLKKLRPAAREARARALSAVDYMHRRRKEGVFVSPSAAARHENTTVGTLRRYGRTALTTDARGRTVVRPYDRLLRVMTIWVPAPGIVGAQQIMLNTRDSRTASLISAWHNAMQHYVRTGEFRRIRALRNRVVRADKRGYRLLTDQRTIDFLLQAGLMDYDSIYQEIT